MRLLLCIHFRFIGTRTGSRNTTIFVNDQGYTYLRVSPSINFYRTRILNIEVIQQEIKLTKLLDMIFNTFTHNVFTILASKYGKRQILLIFFLQFHFNSLSRWDRNSFRYYNFITFICLDSNIMWK